MSRLDELIKELCSDGVEFRALGDVCHMQTGKTQNSSDGTLQGDYAYFTCQKDPKTIDRWDYDLDALLIAGNCEVGRVHSYKGKFCAYQRVYVLSDFDKGVNKAFLKYHIQNSLKPYLHRQSQNGTYRYIVASVLKNFLVPVPPLPVQEEIVRILDTFTELTAKLTAELTARKKQYEYYRSELLKGYPTVALKEVVKSHKTGATPKKGKSVYYENATIPWIRTKDVRFNEIVSVDSYITEQAVRETGAKWIPKNCVIVAISGATAGRCAINKLAATTNQHCLNLEIDPSKALYKFVFYAVANAYEDLIAMKQGARGDLNSTLIMSLRIPLPSLEQQEDILRILGSLDSISSSLESGLPAEIAARQKQYEYYRDKLLDFKELRPEGDDDN